MAVNLQTICRLLRYVLFFIVVIIFQKFHNSQIIQRYLEVTVFCKLTKLVPLKDAGTLKTNLLIQKLVSDIGSSYNRTRSIKEGVLKKFVKVPGKHVCKSLFFNKLASLTPGTLFKKRLWHWCFPVNFAKFLSTPFLKNTSGKLLSPDSHCSVTIFVQVGLLFPLGYLLFRMIIVSDSSWNAPFTLPSVSETNASV